MEQKETIENNGFENFKDQGKNEGVILEKQIKADFWARISMIMLIVGCCLPYFANIICGQLITEPIGKSDYKIIVWFVALILYLISLIACICGGITMRTQKVKVMIAIHVLSVIGIVVAWLFLYGFVYMIFGWFK